MRRAIIERDNTSKTVAIVMQQSIFCKMRSEIKMNESLLERAIALVSLDFQ